MRLLPALDATAPFKPRKTDYARHGFDPSGIADPLYVSNTASASFVPLDAVIHARLLAGDWRQ